MNNFIWMLFGLDAVNKKDGFNHKSTNSFSEIFIVYLLVPFGILLLGSLIILVFYWSLMSLAAKLAAGLIIWGMLIVAKKLISLIKFGRKCR